jgi:hypothetical protein
MTTSEFIARIEKIREKDKHCEVYFKLLNLPVADAVAVIEAVDHKLFNDEIDLYISDLKDYIEQVKQ